MFPCSILWFDIIYIDKLFITAWTSAQRTDLLLINGQSGKGGQKEECEETSRKRVHEGKRRGQRVALRPLACVASSAMNILPRISPTYGRLDLINAI